jgi:hypothetical protein
VLWLLIQAYAQAVVMYVLYMSAAGERFDPIWQHAERIGIFSTDGSSDTTMFGALVVWKIDAKLQVTMRPRFESAFVAAVLHITQFHRSSGGDR